MKIIFQTAAWITRFNLWIVLTTVPFLLFPIGGWPYGCLTIFGIIWISRKINSGHYSIQTDLDILIIILVLTLILGYWISIDPEMSWARLWNYLLGVFIFYSLVNSSKPLTQWQTTVIFISLLAVVIVLFSLVTTDWSGVRLFQIPWLYERFPSLIRNIPGSGVPHESDLINARWIGITLGFMLPFLITFLFLCSKGKFRLILAISCLVAFLDLIMTQSFQGLAGLIAGLIFVAIWYSRKSVLWIILGFGLLLGIFFALGIQKSLVYILSNDNPVGIAVALRLDMWSRAVAMIKEMPFSGIGLNTFSVVQSNFYSGVLIGPEPHAHNLYLQTALDQGIPGLGAMLLMFILWGKTVVNNYKKAEVPGQRFLYIALSAAIISFLIEGLMDGMTLGAKPASIIWIFLGIGAAPAFGPLLSKTSEDIKSTPRERVILPLGILILIVFLVLIFFPGSIDSNIGSLIAQQSLTRTPSGDPVEHEQIQFARDYLVGAIGMNPGSSHLYQIVSRLEARLSNYQATVANLTKVVELDGINPFYEYFPSGYMIRLIEVTENPSNNWDDLLGLYTKWVDRFPTRAEGYVLTASLLAQQKNDVNGAEIVLSRGIDRNAEPRDLLLYYLDALEKIDSQ